MHNIEQSLHLRGAVFSHVEDDVPLLMMFASKWIFLTRRRHFSVVEPQVLLVALSGSDPCYLLSKYKTGTEHSPWLDCTPLTLSASEL